VTKKEVHATTNHFDHIHSFLWQMLSKTTLSSYSTQLLPVFSLTHSGFFTFDHSSYSFFLFLLAFSPPE